jgi:hypothetical protein
MVRMLPNDRTGPVGGGPAPDTFAVGALGVEPILEQTADIARGPAGDCCILCGKVVVNLPLDHGCKPDIDVEAYRAQPSNAFDSAFHSRGGGLR